MKKSTLLFGVLLGIVAGYSVSFFMPQQNMQAGTVDREEKFIMATCPVDESSDAIFVLDLLSGQLRGAWMNPRVGRFTNFYSYNIAGDFNIAPGSEPKFTMTTGVADLPNSGGKLNGDGIIYIAEMVTGQVNAYMLKYDTNQNLQQQQNPLRRLDSFPWRAVVQ